MERKSGAAELKYKFFYPLLGVFFGIIIFFSACEITLRLMVKLRIFKSNNRYVKLLTEIAGVSVCRVSKDPILGFEFIPNSSRNQIYINSDGMRGRKEYARQVPPDTIRIAILGDSETVCLFLPEEDTFSGCLRKTLKDINYSKKFEVLDFGFPGYNIQQKARILETKVMSFNPSIVILYYVFNDPEINSKTVLIKQSFLLKSYFYAFLKFYRQLVRPSQWQSLHQTGGLVNFFQELHNSAYFETCKDKINQIGASLRKRNIRFIVVIAPEIICYDDFRCYPYRNIHKRLLGISSLEVEIFDPFEELASSGYKPTDLWVYPFDCHKGKIANWLIAKSVSKYLFSRINN